MPQPMATVPAEVLPVPPAPTGMLVSYSPVATAKRAGRLRAKLLPNWLRVAASVIISTGWYLWQRPTPKDVLFWLLVISILASVARVVTNIVMLRRARIATSRIMLGPAFKIEPDAVVLGMAPAPERIAWERITSIAGVDKFFSPGPRIEFRWDQGKWSVPVIELDAAPSTVDSAIRAYSRGRFSFDLSKVAGLW